MKLPCLSAVLLSLALAAVSSPGLAGEKSSLSGINPFAAKKKTASASLSDSGTGATTIPSADGTKPTSTKKTPSAPTTWQKFNSGTGAFFSKSRDVLMPWAKKKPAPATHVTGTTKVYNGSSISKKPEEKKTMFSSWFGGKKEKEPETVNDFLGQPRVPF